MKIDEFIEYLIKYYDKDELKKEIERLVLYTNMFEDKKVTQFTVTNEKTNKILKEIGFEWMEPGVKEITQMIEYTKKIQFIE